MLVNTGVLQFVEVCFKALELLNDFLALTVPQSYLLVLIKSFVWIQDIKCFVG